MIVVRTTALCAVLLVSSWLLGGASARAQAPCRGPEVVGDVRLHPLWRQPVSELAVTLSGLSDVERCAVVRVRPEGKSAADVEVRLPDGRSTTRHLARPQELVAVVTSLVTNLPAEPDGSNTDLATEQSARPEVPNIPHLRREFGVAMGAGLRVAARPTFLGYGLVGDLHGVIGRWLYGAWARWDVREHALAQRNVPPDLAMSSFLLGAYGGARFALGPLALDAMLGPNLVLENQEAFEDTRDDVGGDFVEISVGANLRLLAPRTSAWRGFALLGCDVYPQRVGRELRRADTLPALPAFSATVAVGAAWSTL